MILELDIFRTVDNSSSENQTYKFILRWGIDKKIERDITLNSKKPDKDLILSVQDWDSSYENRYYLKEEQNNSSSDLDSNQLFDDEYEDEDDNENGDRDYDQELKDNEKTLLDNFFEFVCNNEKLKEIRERINNEVKKCNSLNQRNRNNDNFVELIIRCDDEDLSKLPWERFLQKQYEEKALLPYLPSPKVSYTIGSNKQEQNLNIKRTGKPRILIISSST